MGVWIETTETSLQGDKYQSHPSWVCGLKLFQMLRLKLQVWVTPFVGVWIETDSVKSTSLWRAMSHPSWVCGLKQTDKEKVKIAVESHPSWVCGLKHNN